MSCGTTSSTPIYAEVGVPGSGGAEGIFEAIMDKASPNFMKTINSEIREAQQTQET